MPDRPLSDREKEEVRNYLRQDKYLSRAAIWAVLGSMLVVGVVCGYLTSPWPGRGPGGGNVPGGFTGPFITTFATLATALIVARLLQRKEPPHAPNLDEQPPGPPSKKP
jgi:hypothetical protein